MAELAKSDLRSLLTPDEEERLDAWKNGKLDVATFFLDSIDELNFTQGSFRTALTRIAKEIRGNDARTCIMVTARPVPFDRQLFERLLPFPPTEHEVTDEDFARAAMGEKASAHKSGATQDEAPTNRTVTLLPFSNEQIATFARASGVEDADALVADLMKRDALDFARRPQDLIELCSAWQAKDRIDTHQAQVRNDIITKLLPRTGERKERAPLSPEKAFDGAARLALAAILTRKLTIAYSAEARKAGPAESALDPAKILSEWNEEERATLLERALFGYASYGRVRFHHRSIVEYLAAQRLYRLLEAGMPIRSAKRLLFTVTEQGEAVARPSMGPTIAWLSLWRSEIFEQLRDLAPSLLLEHGDPQSLSMDQKTGLLKAFAERHGLGEWCGVHVGILQARRFAQAELAPTIIDLWPRMTNPEVRVFLLRLIGAACMSDGLDIALNTASNANLLREERLAALDAIGPVKQAALDTLTENFIHEDPSWPHDLVRGALSNLYPAHMSTERMLAILPRLSEKNESVGDLNFHLPVNIRNRSYPPEELAALVAGLSGLVRDSIRPDKDWPHYSCERAYLVPALAEATEKAIALDRIDDAVLRAITYIQRFNDADYRSDRRRAPIEAWLMTAPSDTGVWLQLLFRHDPFRAVDTLEALFEGIEPSADSKAVAWCGRLFGSRRSAATVHVRAMPFPPDLRLRLLRLVARHVREEDDIHHVGVYSPGSRDDAQDGRNSLFHAVISAQGPGTWEAKMALAADPLFTDLRDRIGLLTQVGSALAADSATFTLEDYLQLEGRGEAPPRTRDELFAVMADRLDDIDDLLLTDASPREEWALIEEEKLMRRAIARQFKASANLAYTVDQEAVTDLEKETDIRLRTLHGQQAAIELKLGDKGRSANELRSALRDQLVGKYLAADECRAGCLLITVREDKGWQHPDTKRPLDFPGLIAFLNEDAQAIMADMNGAVRIMAKGIDLRPRLGTEKAGKESAADFKPVSGAE